jgi:hypothetical protein
MSNMCGWDIILRATRIPTLTDDEVALVARPRYTIKTTRTTLVVHLG